MITRGIDDDPGVLRGMAIEAPESWRPILLAIADRVERLESIAKAASDPAFLSWARYHRAGEDEPQIGHRLNAQAIDAFLAAIDPEGWERDAALAALARLTQEEDAALSRSMTAPAPGSAPEPAAPSCPPGGGD